MEELENKTYKQLNQLIYYREKTIKKIFDINCLNKTLKVIQFLEDLYFLKKILKNDNLIVDIFCNTNYHIDETLDKKLEISSSINFDYLLMSLHDKLILKDIFIKNVTFFNEYKISLYFKVI